MPTILFRVCRGGNLSLKRKSLAPISTMTPGRGTEMLQAGRKYLDEHPASRAPYNMGSPDRFNQQDMERGLVGVCAESLQGLLLSQSPLQLTRKLVVS